MREDDLGGSALNRLTSSAWTLGGGRHRQRRRRGCRILLLPVGTVPTCVSEAVDDEGGGHFVRVTRERAPREWLPCAPWRHRRARPDKEVVDAGPISPLELAVLDGVVGVRSLRRGRPGVRCLLLSAGLLRAFRGPEQMIRRGRLDGVEGAPLGVGSLRRVAHAPGRQVRAHGDGPAPLAAVVVLFASADHPNLDVVLGVWDANLAARRPSIHYPEIVDARHLGARRAECPEALGAVGRPERPRRRAQVWLLVDDVRHLILGAGADMPRPSRRPRVPPLLEPSVQGDGRI
mmetsp:Transcript_24433/g.58070  ORF Transcript_24433/g.58070 Transcript_24433/m.58070 type:complete len:290 (-) Transcript_24433:192-1061(-)